MMIWHRGLEHESMMELHVDAGRAGKRDAIRITFPYASEKRRVERDIVERFQIWPHPFCHREEGFDEARRQEAWDRLINRKENR